MRLVIVGDGIERDTLQQFAARRGLGDAVLFMGAMSRPEKVLGAFDVFALSSDNGTDALQHSRSDGGWVAYSRCRCWRYP